MLRFSFLAVTIFFVQIANAIAPHDARIGIVGGGAAGVSAGYYLKKAGYQNITVLERNLEIGGKTQTITYNGKNYEMGAIMSGPSYKEVIALAKEFDQEIVKFAKGSSGLSEFNPETSTLKGISLKRKMRYLAATLEYEHLYKKYRLRLDEPGLDGLPAELSEPFTSWAKKNVKFASDLEELLAHTFVSFGYGYLKEVPAAYVLRYFSPALLRSFVLGQVHMLKDGYQELWKAVARHLNVVVGFEVKSAQHQRGEWVVRSAAGKELGFDVLIWTAPLDTAAQAIELLPALEGVFGKIRYQHYYSTLVELKGIPTGNGVVTRNYDPSRQGTVVSWLHRWPTEANVVNFYTLSNDWIAPLEVEKQIRGFAKANGFKKLKVVKNVGWRYFPHFDSATLKTDPYRLIESSQGRDSLYFAGEILNFSTVEHSVEYSKALVERFFTGEKNLSFKLPANYEQATSEQKLAFLWKQIERTEYATLPTYENFGDSLLKDILGFLPKQLSRAFNNTQDVIIAERQKLIHKLGSTAWFSFEPIDESYVKFDGLIRFSNAVNPANGTLYPSFSIKVLMDGAVPSVNFNIGKSFDPQMKSNDPKGKPDFNFFRDDTLYPFSNELPFAPKSKLGKAFKWIFDRAHFAPNYIPVDEMTKLMKKPAPRRFVFRAPLEIQNLMSSDRYKDEREVMAQIPVGAVLFEMYESSGLNDPGRLVGKITLRTRLIASRFGDRNLHFRHEDRDLKKHLKN